MRATKPCYAIVVPCEGNDGQGRPIVMESYLDTDYDDVCRMAQLLAGKYGDAMVIELPIRLSTEVVRVAGDASKVTRVQDMKF